MLPKTIILNALRGVLFQNRFMEETLRNVTKGRDVSHWISKLVPNHNQYESPTLRRVEQRFGALDLDLSDLMEWHLYFDFTNETAENLIRLCRLGDVVIDVGANIGAIMLKLALHVGSTGKVLGFEPDPGRFRKCQDYLNANVISNAQLYNMALGNRPGAGKMRVRNSRNLGMNQIVPGSLDAEGTQISIATLDQFADERTLTRLDLMKVDVEGYEDEVLKGAEQTIKRLRPRLYVEIDGTNLAQHESSPEAIYDRLRGWGYSLFFERSTTPLESLRSVPEHFDLLALPG